MKMKKTGILKNREDFKMKQNLRLKCTAAVLLLAVLLSMLLSCRQDENGQKESYSIRYNGVLLKPDMDMATVLEELREEYRYSESPSCAFEGMDKAYEYPHIRIETYPKDGKDLISGIYLTDDKLSYEGVTIGTPVGEMEKKLGEPTENVGGQQYSYTAGDGSQLKCIVREGAVVALYIRSKASAS